MTITEINAKYPMAVSRIVDRIAAFVMLQPNAKQLDLETSSMPSVLDRTGEPTLRITFTATGDELVIVLADVGLHFVDDEVIYLDDPSTPSQP